MRPDYSISGGRPARRRGRQGASGGGTYEAASPLVDVSIRIQKVVILPAI